MKLNIKLLSMSLVALLASALPADSAGPTLKMGDAAPALASGKFIKGEPVTKLEAGKIYVVEFWATWCGPCKESIPHLTELQAQHADVIFIGQDVFERDDSLPEPFVAKMGDKMNYRVAMDDKSTDKAGSMASTWLKPAGISSIPTTFIIGKDGKIAWIGHPMKLGEVLPKVIDGSFDTKAAAAAEAKEDAGASEQQTLLKAFTEARQAKDSAKIIETADNLVAKFPRMTVRVAEAKFDALLTLDETKALDYLRELTVNDRLLKPMLPPSTSVVHRLVDRIVGPMSRIKHPDMPLALDMLERSYKATQEKNPGTMSQYADVLFLAGQYDKAIALKKGAIQNMTAIKNASNDEDEKSREQTYIDRYQTELAAMEKKIAEGPTTKPAN